ncbi:MAG: DotU family type IV/VI secretion system protein [Gammaproteobacteria bacterium]|nr:MAG: DotU family type IV/VI secretion system protein [Gammaproteobacteria bacterium]
MIATHHQQAVVDNGLPSLELEIASSKIRLLPGRVLTHHPKAGLNPLVDAASYLFSLLGKLKYLKSYRQLNKLQHELIQEITTFQEAISHQHYHAEYVMVCRYAICATFDDIIGNTSWGAQGQWEHYSLLATFNQDTQHQGKFFTILERAVKEPAVYIDLMEFLYICLSLGYKGQYRATEHSQYQLEQTTNQLYKHIRAYRGDFHKTLSPSPFKSQRLIRKVASQPKTSLLFIFFVTTCIIMSIFISLGYLMDVISNDAYKHITQTEHPAARQAEKS